MKILIVDNDKDILGVIKKAISSKTLYEADFAHDGEEAIEIMKKNDPYDLLIVDIMMPGISGIDVCEAMVADEKLSNTPVILASSLPIESIVFQEALVRAHKLKLVKDILQKPFEINTLIKKINNIIGRTQTIVEMPRTKTAVWAMGFGLGAILGGPVVAGRLGDRAIGSSVRIGFEVATLILSIFSLIICIRAYKRGERSWVLLVGFVSAVLVIIFWALMAIGGFLFLN